MATLTALIFDFDGVIADTEPLHFACFRHTLAEIGISLTEADYYANYLGYNDRGCFIAALTAHKRPTDPATLAQLMQRKTHAYLESVKDHLDIFPGVREFVR
jgi:beta-phosphoglucomutase